MNTDTPNRLPWPPIIFGGLVVAGILFQVTAPLPISADTFWVGVALLVVGLGLDLWAMVAMARARTNILPHRAADNLVTSGPFAHMRNPIYVGNTIATISLGLLLQNAWLILAAPVAVVLTHHFAVKREAAHLEAKFGNQWRTYAACVKAWWIV
jgi:protein-S-isoprenylcysteine O-methyltransferase Ste14